MEQSLRVIVLLTIPALALSFGGVQKWAYSGLEILVFLELLLWNQNSIRKGCGDISLPAGSFKLILLLFPILLLVLFQLIPLPESICGFFSPGLIDLKNNIGLPDRFRFPMSLTINRYETISAFLLLVTFCLTALLTSSIFNKPGYLKSSIYFLIFTGGVLSFFGIVQFFSWNGRLYWVKPISVGAPFGPFVNHNHFASFINMIILPALSYVFYKYRRIFKYGEGLSSGLMLITFSLILMITALALSGSRGGIISFLMGLAILLILTRREGEIKNKIFSFSIVLLCVILLLLFTKATTVIDTMSSIYSVGDDVSLLYRFKGWNVAVDIVRDFPLFGVGFGTFRDIFLVYRPESMTVPFSHAHNEYVQILVEGGVLGFIAAVLPMYYFIFKRNPIYSRVKNRETRYILLGLFSAIITVMLHNIVEFNLRIPANAYLFSVVAGMYLSNSIVGDGQITVNRVQSLIFAFALVIIALLAASEWRSLLPMSNKKNNNEVTLINNVESMLPEDPWNNILRGKREMMNGNFDMALLHYEKASETSPINGRIWREKAEAALAAGRKEDAIMFMQVACRLDPINSDYIMELSKIMIEAGRSRDAIGIIKTQALRNDVAFRKIMDLMDKAGAAIADYREIAGENPDRLITIGRHFEKAVNDLDSIGSFYRRAVEIDPQNERHIENYANYLIRRKDYGSLLRIENIYKGEAPAQAIYWKSEAYIRQGMMEEGTALLQTIVSKGDSYMVKYGEKLAFLYLHMKRFEEAADIAKKLLPLIKNKTKALEIIAEAYEGIGNYVKSSEYYERLAHMTPSNLRVHLKLADLYEKMGLVKQALREIDKSIEIAPGNIGLRLKSGDMYLSIDNRDKAFQQYEAVLAMDPLNSSVMKRLETMK